MFSVSGWRMRMPSSFITSFLRGPSGKGFRLHVLPIRHSPFMVKVKISYPGEKIKFFFDYLLFLILLIFFIICVNLCNLWAFFIASQNTILLQKSFITGKILSMNLKEIQKPVVHLLKETDRLLKERAKSSISIINKINKVAPISKGKKIRSTLLFLLAGMKGTPSPWLPEIAASIEMFHLSSLIHDDIVDNSELRRGELTLHSNLGSNLSVMWGDFLFISAFKALNKMNKKFLLDITLEAARLMVEGQIIELDNVNNFNVAQNTYYDIINKKTSSLFAAVTHIAGAVNDESPQVQKKYYQFGLDFGIIFQVSDDMLDIFSEISGKDRFSDLKEGKITLPYILLLKKCQEDITPYLSGKNGEKLLDFFEEYNIKETTMKEMVEYHGRALDFLKDFPESIYKKSILNLLEFVKYRDY
jgi:octaprenyl-diphosphate synthase